MPPDASTIENVKKARKGVMRLVDGEGWEVESCGHDGLLLTPSMAIDWEVGLRAWMPGKQARNELLSRVKTVEEAAELLKYRVTGPDVGGCDGRGAAALQGRAAAKEAPVQEAVGAAYQEAYKKRMSWWNRLASRVTINLCDSNIVVHPCLLGYWLRYRDLLLMHGMLVACGVRCAYEWSALVVMVMVSAGLGHAQCVHAVQTVMGHYNVGIRAPPDASTIENVKKARKGVMRLVDGEGWEVESCGHDGLLLTPSMAIDWEVGATWSLENKKEELLSRVKTVEEAAELLKYRVTGPTWEDATDEELQRYKEEQLQKKLLCKKRLEAYQEAYKKRMRWNRLASGMRCALCLRVVALMLRR